MPFIPFEERLKNKVHNVYLELRETEIGYILKKEKDLKQYIILKIAQENLLVFTMLTHGRYRVTWAHELLCKRLEEVERGELKRLIVIAPPRFGKSWISSVTFPIWYMAKNDFHKVMAVSYNSSLVNDFGRHARNMAQSEIFVNIFSVDQTDYKKVPILSKDSKSINRFTLSNQSEYAGVGLGGGTVGKGGHVIIMDDWVKSYKDLTGNKLESDYEFYTSTLYNRQESCEIKGVAAFVVVQTHWHKKDLIGRLMDDMTNAGGEQWEIFHIRAEAVKNEFYPRDSFYFYP